MSPAGPHLVLGTGRAGLAAVRALREAGAPVRAWDGFDGETTRARRDALSQEGVEVVLGAWDPALLTQAPLVGVVKSPGIPLDAAAVRDAQAAGLEVVDELEIGVRRTRRELVAVTGTDGKSTVASLVAAALGEDGAPAPVTGNTEFGPPLSAAPVEGGPLVVEASSYQLAFTAPAFARLAVLTNITEEHLHRHGSLAAYSEAKRRAFLDGRGRCVPLAVVGIDDAPGRQLAADLRAAGTTVATVGGEADYTATEVRSELDGAVVRARTPAGPITLRLRLPGAHNARNALAALAAVDLLGVDRDRATAALESFGGVPGRWEWIGRGEPCDAIVDFAHTPAALRAVLETVREIVARRGGGARCHLVLSASGSTTPHKRGPLGAVGRELADRVFVTDAGFGGQAREEVFDEILAGAAGQPTGPELEVVPDRREAIRAALAGARPGDVVLVSDRGARPRWITDPAGGGFPWDDREVVAEEHARLRG